MDRRRLWFALNACTLLVMSVRIAVAAEPSGGTASTAEPPRRNVSAADAPQKSASAAASPEETASTAKSVTQKASATESPSQKAGATKPSEGAIAAEPAQHVRLTIPDPNGQQATVRPAPSSTVLSTQPVPAALQGRPSLRLPAFIALGIGGLSAGGAVVTGIMERGRQYDPKYDCAGCDGDRAMDNKLALATKVLAGVATVGVSTGLILLLTAPQREKPSFKPSLGVSVSGSKASAKATWNF